MTPAFSQSDRRGQGAATLNRADQSLFPAPQVVRADRPDGTIILTNALPLPPAPETIPHRLLAWAQAQPNAPFLSEPTPDGRRTITYSQAWSQVVELGRRFLALGLGPDRPLMILAGNSINHALTVLAAMSIGAPAAVMSPAYASPAASPWTKLAQGLDHVGPGLILSQAPDAVGQIIAGLGVRAEIQPVEDLSWLDDVSPASRAQFDAALARVTDATVAKLLFTSGSTGSPKAVINTQGMMTSNMQALALVWPFLNARPPVLVDWLPWNHTFGGNCCFNLALYFGGQFHIDQGKPLPAQIGHTVQALRQIAPTLYFNVPAGWEALLPTLEGDIDFARQFFSRVDFLFNAGAALPASIRQRLSDAAMRAMGGVPPIIAGWGSTETAPFSTVVYFPTEHSTNLGAPLPGTEIKMVPFAERHELRVRGPNVMPGYWNQPQPTAEAFDEEGFFRIGDAGRLVDPQRPEAGILFDGRVAENFKLSSGTWVNVGALRLEIIAATKPLVSDVVIAGEGQDHIGLLVFPNEAACRQLLPPQVSDTSADQAVQHETVLAALERLISDYNRRQTGSSTRVRAYRVQTDPPNARYDEITEKGYLNQRAVLSRRADEVALLFAVPAVQAAS